MECFKDCYRGKRILITGHTGFKGSWLSLWLVELGASVAGYSLDIPTEPSNFALLELDKHLEHHIGDIRDRAKLVEVIDTFRPDIIFHMAAQALVRRSYNDPVTTFETNMMGMVNILDCVRNRPWIQAVVVITSDKAYRNDEWCWGYRETDILAGIDPYSASKSCADIVAGSYFESFLKNTPTKFAITRAGNVIGGGDWAEDRIVPDCIRAWSKGQSVIVRSPKATRPWQHVLEPLGGYLHLGARLIYDPASINGEAFNFGPNASVNQTVEELLDEIKRHWPTARWEVPQGMEVSGHEAKLLKLSCDKALFHLGWSAQMDFAQTVAFTANWYRAWQENPSQIYGFTLGQIRDYVSMAANNAVPWAKP